MLKALNLSTLDQLVGKTIYDLLIREADAVMIDNTDKDIMESGKIKIIEETIQTSIGVRNYLSHKHPIFNEKNEVIGLLGYSIDISEIKKTKI